MTTIVSICHHTKLFQYYWLYFLCCILLKFKCLMFKHNSNDVYHLLSSFTLLLLLCLYCCKRITLFSIKKILCIIFLVLPRWLRGKDSTSQCKRHRRCRFDPWVRNPLEEEMTIHSNILDWKIPWTEEAGGLQARRVRLN